MQVLFLRCLDIQIFNFIRRLYTDPQKSGTLFGLCFLISWKTHFCSGLSSTMSCSACSTDENELVVCDYCGAAVCKDCSGLTVTELRAVAINKRILLFLCPECKSKTRITCNFSAETLGNLIRESIERMVPAVVEMMTTDLRRLLDDDNGVITSKMDKLSDDIENLKASNIDLVRTCSRLRDVGGRHHMLAPEDAHVGHPQNKFTTKARLRSSGQPPETQSSKPIQPVVVNALPSGNRYSHSPSSETRKHISQPTSGKSVPSVRSAPIVGSRRPADGVGIAAAKVYRKTSVFVSRLDKDVSAEDLTKYLSSTFGKEEKFVVEEQKVRSGDYRSYRVEGKYDLLEDLLTPSNWPENIFIKKFRFFQRRPGPST